MKLGYFLGYANGTLDFNGTSVQLPVERVQLADRLGYYAVWTAESYGADALSPLAYLAALTKQIHLGTALMILPARPPAAAAMAVQTIDQLAGGSRFICALGTSGPQVVEGWYGQPWGKPMTRLRDYITIMRKMFKREGPLSHQGKEISVPYTGQGESGFAKPLKSILHTNPDLPIWIGCGTEASIKLCAEIADGWLPLSFIPGAMANYAPWIEEGFKRAGGGKSWTNFEIHAFVPVIVSDDVAGALTILKRQTAMYVGGMGAKDKNFHKDMMVERGYGEAAARIQELFMSKRFDEAIKAVPDDYLDERSLVGPPARIAERYKPWADCGLTGLIIRTEQDEALELMAKLAADDK